MNNTPKQRSTAARAETAQLTYIKVCSERLGADLGAL